MRVFVFLLLGLWPTLAWAAGPEASAADRIAAGLAARYGGLTALSAAYRRVAATPATDQLFKSRSQQVATGVLYWARPDRLLLDQVSPHPKSWSRTGPRSGGMCPRKNWSIGIGISMWPANLSRFWSFWEGLRF